ncbi:hypothetical protein RS030_2246 [Cryptosporidium xiaoi]|uniref:Uncharacterized protein n=1 Tax=Cryptosporidium xiaoi TaxID=659607 RepID=A0AAV9XVY4_9CRYT
MALKAVFLEENSDINGDLINNEIDSFYVNDLKPLNGYNEFSLNNEFATNINIPSIETTNSNNIDCNVEITDIWVTIPLVFPIATLHSISTPGEHPYSEFIGGSLCFSPDDIDVARIFSTIQGISDIGATFFQIVIAKLVGVTVDNIEMIKNEFNEIFNCELFDDEDFISVKPIGWRKRNDYIMNSTIPFKKTTNSDLSQEKKSFYNSILILEDNLYNCNKKLLRLGTLVDSFLEKINKISPLIEITKITDVKKNSFFEVTIRIQPMLSYISADGEDFEIKCGLNSEFYDCKYNSSLIHLGDIRLINPHSFEIDNRVSCGLFKTFSLISKSTLFQLSNLPVASYTPLVCTNKKRNQQSSKISSINTKQFRLQGADRNNSLSPGLSIFYDKSESLIKTPPPTNVISNNSTRYCSTASNSDLGYNNTVFENKVAKKSINYTPTTISSLNKITHTPLSPSLTEIECSPWINSDRITSSFLSSGQNLQKLVPSGIQSVSFMNDFYNMNDIQLLTIPLNSNTNNGDISNFNCNEPFNEVSVDLNNEDFGSGISLNINDSFNDSFEVQISKSSHDEQDNQEDSGSSKYSDIIDLLDSIFSDKIRENIINDHKVIYPEYNSENRENINFNIGGSINFYSEHIFSNDNKFDCWGFAQFNNSLTSNTEQKDANITEDSEFITRNNSTKLDMYTFL